MKIYKRKTRKNQVSDSIRSSLSGAGALHQLIYYKALTRKVLKMKIYKRRKNQVSGSIRCSLAGAGAFLVITIN